MSSKADDIILALREHLEAKNDADLARKLRIDKSTVSSWRSRGRVPDRFRRIAEGDSHEAVATLPTRWGEHEDKSFQLALFRYSRLFGPTAGSGDFRAAMELFSKGTFLWYMLTNAQDDLAERQKNGDSLSTAFALTLHEDIASPDSSCERDLRRLEEYYEGSLLALPLKQLRSGGDL